MYENVILVLEDSTAGTFPRSYSNSFSGQGPSLSLHLEARGAVHLMFFYIDSAEMSLSGSYLPSKRVMRPCLLSTSGTQDLSGKLIILSTTLSRHARETVARVFPRRTDKCVRSLPPYLNAGND